MTTIEMKAPGATVSRTYHKGFCIREVLSRFGTQTVFFVHQLGKGAEHIDGPFYSMRTAISQIEKVS